MLSDGKKRQQCKRRRNRGHNPSLLERRLFLPFSDNKAVVLRFLTMQDKYNISTLWESIKFICTRCETGNLTKDSRFILFLKLAQINYIFSDNVRILPMYKIYEGHQSDISPLLSMSLKLKPLYQLYQ